ncbi:gamma-glutamyl-gamma-aminobutyrate hydrolase family protein [Alkalicoccus daliensis]|uniref:Putative glutamine amidotransferase n=1 Tax=Alkalicoccus daliensis TaxID=745820 RepID=A0A1G9ZDT6_9BACI|nr:gamma-glutamyl-gamma-aminobutyrate hydrolase family protein [Alkalicoccus daliensis]SDN19345.1 putative glutamine amidotransferase [Alkalicoccus daliensis]
MLKPVIGVLPLYDEEKESYWMLPGYMKGIEEAGGIPVMLPLTADKEVIGQLAEMYDGFLFTGGHDISPTLYGEDPLDVCGPLCLERDEMEKILFFRLLELNKPILGICRAIQLFNALLGGTLYQDLPTQLKTELKLVHKQSPPYHQPSHRVYIPKDNFLYQLIQEEDILVNSYHHQAIKNLSSQLTPQAEAEDGIIEAAAMTEKRFVLAVQWHPEFSYQKDAFNHRLFAALVKAAEKKIEFTAEKHTGSIKAAAELQP